jgi:quercetin dioxygenase-like cupin family protein
MNKQEFRSFLAKNGFPEPILVKQPPNSGLDTHKHDFEVYALITEGSIQIDTNGTISTYKEGDMFYLQYQQLHKEKYGTIGVKYLASRKI